MAYTTPIEPSISVEWAESLIALSIKVPDHWWDDFHGYKLHDGKIVSLYPHTEIEFIIRHPRRW
jgi:hypothetical protein